MKYLRRFARFKGGYGIWPYFRCRLALTEPHQQGRLAWLLLAAFQAFFGSLMSLSGVEGLLVGAKTSYLGDVTGTFVNRNPMAAYLDLTLACGVGLLLALRDERAFRSVNVLEMLLGPKGRLRLALVLMAGTLLMTHSPLGNVAFSHRPGAWQRESVYRNGVGFGASVGIVALLMHAFADFNLQIPANAATYVVLCAIAVIGNNHYRERCARTRD